MMGFHSRKVSGQRVRAMVKNDPGAACGAIRVKVSDAGLSNLSRAVFAEDGGTALAVAFISPGPDFAAIATRLAEMASPAPCLAVSTAGALASGEGPLYREPGTGMGGVVLQIFAPTLVSMVRIATVGLHNADIRGKAEVIEHEERIKRIAAELSDIDLPFPTDFRDTLALAFVDGLSGAEGSLMEAVYRTRRFPFLFAGGSAASLDFTHTTIHDGERVLEDHAVIAFVKLAPGMRFSVLKSHNFELMAPPRSFVVVDADPDRRVVSTVLDPAGGMAVPMAHALAEALACRQDELERALSGCTFGIEVDQALHVRSVSHIDGPTGAVTFYCDVNPGDELWLLSATDFALQTRRDLAAFLDGKPPPLGAILFDCILRRRNNPARLSLLDGLWEMPAAGFSTFGELLGVNLNQTLTALVFFDGRAGEVRDATLDAFPIHYGGFESYFVKCRLNRIEALNRLRTGVTKGLARHLGASPALIANIEDMLSPTANIQATMTSIRATITREVVAESRAREAEQILADAIETMGEGFALYDRYDRLAVCNTRYRQIFKSAEEVIRHGVTYAEIAHAATMQQVYDTGALSPEDFLAMRIAQHKLADGQARIYAMSDGRWVSVREYRTPNGGIVATRNDVTALKRREQEMEALKLRYESILDAAGDGIVGIDQDGAVTFANRMAGRLLGRNPARLVGRDYREILAGSPSLPHLDAISPRAGKTRQITIQGRLGQPMVVEYDIAAIIHDDAVLGAVLVFRDISLRKLYEESIQRHQEELTHQVTERTQALSAEIEQRARAETVLRRSQDRLMGITTNLFEGVLLVDIWGHILFANASAQRLLGRADGRLAGTDLDEAMVVVSQGRELDFQSGPFQQAIETGTLVVDDDAVFQPKGIRPISVGFAAAPLIEDGKRLGAVVSFRSIEALKAAQREALQSSKLASVGQLAAGIAHEINTPIQYVGDNLQFLTTSIGTLARMVDDLRRLAAASQDRAISPADEKELDFLLEEMPLAAAQSLEGVRHVAHIVRSMKDFSHPGSTAKMVTDLNRAIDSTLAVSRNEWKRVAEIETDLDPDLPSVLCLAADINQVLLNLIVNAAQAIGQAKPRIPGRIAVRSRRDGDWIEIRVADNGPGIPPEIRDKVFDPFFTTKGVGKGTGQGLAISRDVVVEKHGGKLFIDETCTAGAAFVMRLPIGTVPIEAPPAQGPAKIVRNEGEEDPWRNIF